MRRSKSAIARHILVKSRGEAEAIKKKLDQGQPFEQLARKHSTCPSKKQGGSLGEFRQGEMVPAFDKVVFKAALKQVHGPIKTQFGFHLIEILYRDD